MTKIIVHTYLLSTIIHICFIYSYLAFRINDNDSTTTWLCNMHVVPIRASSPQLIEHRLSTWYEWSSIQQGIKLPTLYMNGYTFNRGSSPQLYMNDYTFNRASSPQIYMSMRGLNNLINNNVRHRRLDNFNIIIS